MGQGFKEVAALRTDEKKFNDNFNKIDWSKSASSSETTAEVAEEEIINEEFSLSETTISEDKVYNELFAITYEDDRRAIAYGIKRNKHVFVLHNFDKGEMTFVDTDKKSPLTDALLGVMNEIHLLRTVEMLSQKDGEDV